MTRPAPFTVHEGVAAPLLIDNVDTDQIIPSREIKAVSRDGLVGGLFAGWRYIPGTEREPDPDFVLNQPEHDGASILLAGANFGCGSSREHAVWALAEYGFRAILARSFGDIFRTNCTRNGILPITLPGEWIEAAAREGGRIRIDLAAQEVTAGGQAARFEIGSYEKRLLLEGLDPIALTLRQKDLIDRFKEHDAKARPWL